MSVALFLVASTPPAAPLSPLTTGLVVGGLALVGVLIGGLINYLATVRIDKKARRRAMRTASRLVAAELQTDYSILFATLEVGTYLPMGNAPLHLTEWDENRAVLATELDYAEWRELRDTYSHIRTIKRNHAAAAPDRPFTPMDVNHLHDARDQAERAKQLLEPYAAAES